MNADESGTADTRSRLAASVFPQPSAPAARQGARPTSHGTNGSIDRTRLSLDTDRPPPPIPHGWFAARRSDELDIGAIEPLIAVARDLVVYRDDSGAAHVADAHCPHLGAHLGGGKVIGDAIKCPYHGWSFGSDGHCVDIPYHDGRIPARACVRTYPVVEQDGYVFFWYHPESAPPAFELPRVDVFGDGSWAEPVYWSAELTAALQEMGENNVDYAHLRYVHRRPTVPDDTSVFTTDGPFSRVVEKLPDGMEFYREAWGPGVALLHVPDVMIVLTTTTPIDRRHCRLQWTFHFATAFADASELLLDGVVGEYGLMADVPIWRDKVFVEHPPLVRSDGNIAEFRAWYSQFYSD